MNKLLLAIGMIALLAGCGEYESVKGKNGNQTKTIYMVDGKPLECINRTQRLSCNWSKHNKLFEGE